MNFNFYFVTIFRSTKKLLNYLFARVPILPVVQKSNNEPCFPGSNYSNILYLHVMSSHIFLKTDISKARKHLNCNLKYKTHKKKNAN